MTRASSVWRDHATDGDPGSGKHNPEKSDIRQWALHVERASLTPEMMGANGAGATDDATYLQDWADEIVTTARHGVARGTYRQDTTWGFSDPDDVHIDALGATFTTANDILMIDGNKRADPTYTDNESRQFLTWRGGKFICTNATKSKAAAIRLFGMRKATISEMIIGDGSNTRGFQTGLLLAGKDTVTVENVKFYANERDILLPPWSTSGGPLEFHFRNLHHSHGDFKGAKPTLPCLQSYVAISDSFIDSCSYNLGTSATCTAIEIIKYVLLPVSGGSGTWSAGETVTGGTSGATMTLVEVYDHDFAFDVSQPTRWLVGHTRSSATFTPGETLTGGTSSATAVLSSSATAIVDGDPMVDFQIRGSNHFEAGSGASGAIGIHIADKVGFGGENWVTSIDVGKMNLAGGGSIGVKLENVKHVTVNGYFSMENGGTDKILQTDADCEDIAIVKPFKAPFGTIDLNSMSRDELDMSAFDQHFTAPQNINFSGTLSAGSTSATATSLTGVAATQIGGLYPKQLSLRVRLNGSTASGATQARLRVFVTGETTAAQKQAHQIGGFLDAQDYWAAIKVPLDSSGDFEFDGQNTSAGTLAYTGQAMAVHY